MVGTPVGRTRRRHSPVDLLEQRARTYRLRDRRQRPRAAAPPQPTESPRIMFRTLPAVCLAVAEPIKEVLAPVGFVT